MGKLNAKEKEIQRLMKTLELDRKEAEELYAFDNEEIENEVVDKIEEEQKAVRKAQEGRSSIERVKHMKAKVVSDENRDNIIDDIFTATMSSEHTQNPQDMGTTKLSFQDKDGFFYTVQVTKHRSRPDGYAADLRDE